MTSAQALQDRAISEGGVYLHLVAPSRGMRRFYRLQIQPTIFGEVDLIREWGRIGRDHRPRRQVTHHRDLGELLEQLRAVLVRRFQRGYRPGPPLASLGTPSQEPSSLCPKTLDAVLGQGPTTPSQPALSQLR